jgi:hypothetical protein
MKMATAISSAGGTTLPRLGFFRGVRAPQYQAVVVATELCSAQPGGETRINVPASGDEAQQTTSLSLPRCSLLLESLLQTGHPVIRIDDFAHAVLPDWNSTDSPWQSFRRILMPLRSASEALDEDVRDTLKPDRLPDDRVTHAGLAAVSRLVDILGLTRPTILRMGGVPSSTFYAWRNNPHAVIRTPTISRLLRLQAQIAILDEALGRERMRAWVLSAARFEKLQGSDVAFAQVLAEAADALVEATQIKPQRRLRRADYTASLDRDDSSTQQEGSVSLSDRSHRCNQMPDLWRFCLKS